MNNIKSLGRTALISFFCVYIIWGSTYLAIRYAIETLPAFGMTSVRFFIAAAIMGVIAYFKREALLSKEERKVSIVSGVLLIGANAIVCMVEYWVPSGIVAVIIGAMPIWIMLLGWASFGQARPQILKMLGALIGLAGVALIAFDNAPKEITGVGRFGILILISSGVLWAAGTLYQRRIPQLKSIFRFSTIQMLAGAISTGLLSLAFEKPWTISPESISLASMLALVYLIVFGSIIAFTAYSWLSRNVEPHLVSTYALVNPVIAVLLGRLFFREPVTPLFISATALVLIGVTLLMTRLNLKSFFSKFNGVAFSSPVLVKVTEAVRKPT